MVALVAGMAQKSQAQIFELTPTGFDPVVLEFEGRSAKSLQNSCLTRLNSFYVYPEKVLKVVDGHSIVVNAVSNSAIESKLYTYQLEYVIEIFFKDGRMRVEPHMSSLTKTLYDLKTRVLLTDKQATTGSEEINAIWHTASNGEYFVLHKDVKKELERWFSAYVQLLVQAINEDNW
jgi:hypothetical protein